MWCKLSLCGAMLMVCLGAIAEEECGSAVDAADRLAPDSDKHCDYTHTGLNGVLHKALSGKKSEVKEVVESKINQSQEVNIAADKMIAMGVFDSAQQLQSVKFSLLEMAANQCSKGFVVESERYMPTATTAPSSTKAMKLELAYQCL